MEKKVWRSNRSRALSVLLTVLFIAAILPISSSASALSAEPSGSLEFTNAQLLEMGTPLNLGEHGWSKKVTAYFSDPESKYALSGAYGTAGYYAYWDRDGVAQEVYDVVGKEYYQFAPFFEGLAAVVKYDPNASLSPVDMRWTVGYVNEKGEEVIPCIYNVIPDTFSQDYFTSRFKDGYAYVYKAAGINGYHDIRGSIAKIDKTGKIVGDWVDYGTFLTYDIRANIDHEPIFRQLQLVSGIYSGFHDYSTDYFTLTNTGGDGLGTITVQYPMTADGIIVPVYQGGTTADAAVIIKCADLGLGPAAERTRYQSTAKLTKGSIADLNYDDFEVTITNPTDAYDSGTVALVLASDRVTIHFVDYALAPKESRAYSVAVSGHMAIPYGQSLTLLNAGWGAFLNADIITFDSDEDRDAYRSAVVYEENIDHYVTQGTGKNVHVVICDEQPGDDWLKKYTGIERKNKPDLNPAFSHNRCGK